MALRRRRRRGDGEPEREGSSKAGGPPDRPDAGDARRDPSDPRPRSERAAPDLTGDPTSDEGARLTVEPGVRLWVRVVGDGPSTVVVPCSGNAADLAALAAPQRRIIFYDARNRGRSDAVTDRRRLGFTREVADLGTVVEALDLDRYALVGWSYHAGVVADHALANPERVQRMVLAAAIAPRSGTSTRPGDEPTPAQLARLDQLQASGLPAKAPQRWCEEWRRVYVPLLMGDPSGFERMASPCAMPNERPQHVAQALVPVFWELRAYDWRPALEQLRVPTLVVHGEEDREPVDSAFEWAGALPDGQVLVLPGVGQLPWVERPEAFFDAVGRFLDGPPATG